MKPNLYYAHVCRTMSDECVHGFPPPETFEKHRGHWMRSPHSQTGASGFVPCCPKHTRRALGSEI